MRARQQVGLQPGLVVLQGLDDRAVAGGEPPFEVRVGDVGERRRHVVLEEIHQAGQLLQRDLRVDPRRVVEVPARVGQRGGHLFLAGDQCAQPRLRRGELALHQGERAAGDAAGIAVGILLPRPDRLQREQGAADVVEQQLAVALHVFAERLRVHRGHARLPLPERLDVGVDAGARVVLQLAVPGMQAVGGGGARVGGEVVVVEIAVGQAHEGLVGGRCRAGGGRGLRGEDAAAQRQDEGEGAGDPGERLHRWFPMAWRAASARGGTATRAA